MLAVLLALHQFRHFGVEPVAAEFFADDPPVLVEHDHRGPFEDVSVAGDRTILAAKPTTTVKLECGSNPGMGGRRLLRTLSQIAILGRPTSRNRCELPLKLASLTCVDATDRLDFSLATFAARTPPLDCQNLPRQPPTKPAERSNHDAIGNAPNDPKCGARRSTAA